MIKTKRLFQMALRNLARNKRRTTLTLLIFILGSSGILLVGGFFQNIMDRFRETYIHSHTGHLQVSAEGFYELGSSRLFDFLMKNGAKTEQILHSNPHVLFAVPRLQFGGMASSEVTNIPILAIGVDPVLENKMGNFETSRLDHAPIRIVEGENLDPTDPSGVILGKGLMKALGLKVRDVFNFITSRRGGALDGGEYKVKGTYETIMKVLDDRTMKMNLPTARSLLGLSDEVHSFLVILDETGNTAAVHAALQSEFRTQNLSLEAISWEQQGQYYRQSKAFLDKIFATVLTILSIIFCVSIANTINMSLFERMREFGTMMALGNGRGVIFSIILLEGTLMGFMGAVLGLGIGSALAHLISAVGIPMPPPPMGSYGYLGMISLTPLLFVESFFLCLVSALLASLLPAYRASHVPIIRALGYV